MAQTMQPETLGAWMRIIERRMTIQERRGNFPDDIYDVDDSGGTGTSRGAGTRRERRGERRRAEARR